MAKIMIIDDDVEIAQNTAAGLKAAGHSVNLRDDTAGAVEALRDDRPDVLVLDVMFPSNPAAGFDLAREIRHTDDLKELPIILLTGVNQEFPMDFSGDDIDPEWMPIQEFLEKPVDMDALKATITKLLDAAS